MKSYNPELVILSGIDYEDLAGTIEPQDIDLLEGDLSDSDIEYLTRKYPELMGVWVKVIKTVGKGLKRFGKKIFGAIGRRIRRKRARKRKKRAAKTAAANRARAEQQRKIQVANYMEMQRRAVIEQKKKSGQTMLLTAAAAAAAALFLLGA